jgi:hypothetical protein
MRERYADEMLRRGVPIAGLALLLCGSVLADVTVRQTNSTKLSSFIPPEIATQWQQQSQSGINSGILRIKGDKAYASYGALETLTDYTRNEVTLLDAKSKHYATVPLAEFADRFSAALKATTGLSTKSPVENPQFDVHSKKTGLTEMIRGVRAEETLIVLTMQMPYLSASGPGSSDSPSLMRLEVRSWVAQPAEIRRVLALRELADYAERGRRALDTADFAEKALSAIPVIGEQLSAAMRELAKTASGLTMKTSISVYLPAITQLVQLAPEGAPPDFDPNAPIAESTLDLTEISTASLPDSHFQVPADYQPAPFDELVRTAVQSPVGLPSAVPSISGTLPGIR